MGPLTIYDFLCAHGQIIEAALLRRFTDFCLGDKLMRRTAKPDIDAANAVIEILESLPWNPPSHLAKEVERQLRWWAENDPQTFAMMIDH